MYMYKCMTINIVRLLRVSFDSVIFHCCSLEFIENERQQESSNSIVQTTSSIHPLIKTQLLGHSLTLLT